MLPAMTPRLEQESENLLRSWMRHDAEMLRTYLVADVEHPALNLQSVLSRHFLLRSLTNGQFEALMEAECRFALAMNWLAPRLRKAPHPDDWALILYALQRGVSEAEGIEIPHFVARIFAGLPAIVSGLAVPNYIEAFLTDGRAREAEPGLGFSSLQTFFQLWRAALVPGNEGAAYPRWSVVEPACGSANDYRAWDACGLAPLVDYTGFDLCPRNVENARGLFPGVKFELGNVFEIAAGDQAFDFCLVHDLFEHLSLEGLQTAVREICRVTRRGGCVGFFNMDEIPDHEVRPVESYHWNRLSMARVRSLFAEQGFLAQVIHIGAFLREEFGCDQTHNPNAYTFYLSRSDK
jgi:SAM-dependent methyltransferase